jgi:hypothetical protein
MSTSKKPPAVPAPPALSPSPYPKGIDPDLARGLDAVANAIGHIVAQHRRCCLNCLQFNEKTETCALAKARPPARVIAYGCPKWEEDIPF